MSAILSSYNFRNHGPLSNEQLFRVAPSIFADRPASTTSEKYKFIPTIDAVEALRNEGFFPVKAGEARARIDEKKGYTRHIIRFRREGDTVAKVGDSIPEIVLLNSHDGTSSYQLTAGLFRLVCSNGLVVSDSVFDTVRVRHSGNIVDDVIEGSYRVIEESPRIFDQVRRDEALLLTDGQQEAFARAALQLRWDTDEDGNSTVPIQASQLLRPRRYADNSKDLWSTFNRVQENLVRGGLSGRNSSGNRTSTRAVASVDANTKLNKALWTLKDELANLLAA
ncbi:MAG: hypothetical protein RLZ25_1579 [Pseudomonadota bacterium]